MPRPDRLSVATAAPTPAVDLERRGRRWLIISFLACPCHLPLTLAAAGAVLGGTALGAALRDHPLAAGLVVGTAWLAGTARGLWLVHRAERDGLACGISGRGGRRGRRRPQEMTDPLPGRLAGPPEGGHGVVVGGQGP